MMAQDNFTRPRWKIVHSRIPASVSEVIDIVLRNRNLDASAFSGDLKDLAEHLSIRGMSEGAELLAKHITLGHKIVIVADYDCDGITSAAQMALFLQDIAYPNFQVLIPSRLEGYGVPERAVTQNPDAKVFVALDCGTLDFEPVISACSMGADFIVIDHHEVPADKGGLNHAPATVLINPKHPDCCSHFKEFCASGLTFLFLAALRQALKRLPASPLLPRLGGKYLALAATGTVSDLVPLVSANRILARTGLRNLNANSFAPLCRLAEGAGLAGKTLTAGHIGFYLGPRINAAGRVSEGQIAYDLLTSREPAELTRLAARLEELNGLRRAQESKIVAEIASRLTHNPPASRTLVLASPEWLPGVVGIAASRVQQDHFYGPVVVLAIDPTDGTARGSARSIPGFDMHHALSLCSDLLVRWGGHKAAAGLTIAANRIEQFTERMEAIASEQPADIFVQRGKVDLELPLTLVGPPLIRTLEQLEPHGIGNPTPVFCLRGAKPTSVKTFGKEQNHLRIEFPNGIEGVWWRGANRFPGRRDIGKTRDIVFRTGWNDFRKKATLEILDLGDLFASRTE